MKRLLGISVMGAILAAAVPAQGQTSPAVSRRMKELGITHVFQGVHDKRSAYESLLASLGLNHEQVGSIGDDVVDLPILSRCGFAAAVPAAPPFVREHVHYVTTATGGAGAAREFCDFILAATGRLDALQRRYLG